jgi:hypothetical protein
MNYRIPVSLLLALSFAASQCFAGDAPQPECRHRNAEIERDIGYCQAVRVGDTLYVSGITASGQMEEAVPKVYEILKAVLASNAMSMVEVIAHAKD